jgi:hypothetical protein
LYVVVSPILLLILNPIPGFIPQTYAPPVFEIPFGVKIILLVFFTVLLETLTILLLSEFTVPLKILFILIK